LLANIALHGLETAIMASFPRYRMVNGTRERWQPQVIRYADDFVVLHQDKAVIERCQQVATEWLRGIGLELKPSKTRITHTLHPHEGNVGFDFLGFVRHEVAHMAVTTEQLGRNLVFYHQYPTGTCGRSNAAV